MPGLQQGFPGPSPVGSENVSCRLFLLPEVFSPRLSPLQEAYSVARQFNMIPPVCEQAEYHLFQREKVEVQLPELYHKIGESEPAGPFGSAFPRRNGEQGELGLQVGPVTKPSLCPVTYEKKQLTVPLIKKYCLILHINNWNIVINI